MTKLIVDIKRIEEIGDTMAVYLHCRKPKQKTIPWSHGRKELDRNNLQFEIDSKQHQEDMGEYKKELYKLHVGKAILTQNEGGEIKE